MKRIVVRSMLVALYSSFLSPAGYAQSFAGKEADIQVAHIVGQAHKLPSLTGYRLRARRIANDSSGNISYYCEDSKGKSGWNPIRAGLLARTKYGECLGVNIDDAVSPAPMVNADLRGAVLKGLLLYYNVDLSNADLTGANLMAANLVGVNSLTLLVGTKMANVNLAHAYIVGPDMTRAILRGANFQWATVDSIVFEKADLRNANFQGTDFSFLRSMKGADFRGAVFSGAVFQGADFTGADLRGADLRGANISHDVQLRDADLRDALYDEYTKFNSYMYEAIDPAKKGMKFIKSGRPPKIRAFLWDKVF
ncbi:MAG: pentapeptide repeat-containing protein [Elusimicrobia bacterium]|nr:pentapeptide repeat-containing protein [Elusimicrobiota bacterium]